MVSIISAAFSESANPLVVHISLHLLSFHEIFHDFLSMSGISSGMFQSAEEPWLENENTSS
jgi:hypothetical protein